MKENPQLHLEVDSKVLLKRLDLPQATIWSSHQFIPNRDADNLYHQLLDSTPWKQESIKIFGKQVPQPRLQAWYGERDYQYSGLKLTPIPLPDFLLPLKQQCELAANQKFNSVLINLYRDGEDSMGWHQDNEPELGEKPVIASISLGAERKFSIKHLTTNEKHHFQLSHGSLLIMGGKMQHHWKHCLPKTRRAISSRINLTFRYIY